MSEQPLIEQPRHYRCAYCRGDSRACTCAERFCAGCGIGIGIMTDRDYEAWVEDGGDMCEDCIVDCEEVIAEHEAVMADIAAGIEFDEGYVQEIVDEYERIKNIFEDRGWIL